MLKRTLITSRDQEGICAVSLFEAAYNKSRLDNARAQWLNERGDELQDGIVKLIVELTTSNRYADEEVESNYVYPKEYKGPKTIKVQIKALAKIFDLNPSHALEFAKNLPELPEGSEGWFAIPKWQMIAPTYGEAVEKTFEMIGLKRKFYNYRDGQLGAEYLRQHKKTMKKFLKIELDQSHSDIFVVPCQFGLRHKGRSVRRAREVFEAREFGLGAFSVGIMLLIHPEREVQWEQLHIDCAGDELASGTNGGFSRAPLFYVHKGLVKFGTQLFDDASEYFGSASAFLW